MKKDLGQVKENHHSSVEDPGGKFAPNYSLYMVRKVLPGGVILAEMDGREFSNSNKF